MPKLWRLLLACASVLLLVALALPLWHVQLFAPQYPEGLGMVITARTVRGAAEHDLQSINALNHYIGMKTIEPDDIPDLRVIPWFIGGLAAVGFAIAAAGGRKLIVGWLSAFTLLGVAGLVDFYKWEYSYGHDLDYEHAIIKVPGMTDQPPLIGSKQLLNFTASSWPSLGSAAIGAAFLLGVAALIIVRRAPAAGGRPPAPAS